MLNFFPANRMNAATGYGRLELGLMKGLVDAGVPFRMVDNYAPPADGITLITGFPTWGEYIPGRKWILTMSESTRVSAEWVDLFNQMYERVLVPAPFLIDVYKKCGVTVPVDLLPLGVDYHMPEWVERWPQETFNWLTYSLGDTRKGADLAMLAFNRQFGGNPQHHLYIKCRDNPMWMTGLDDPQMTIVRGELPEADVHALMAKCHAFIFPSLGEGFGYPPREAVLSGMPTIATGAHGLWDAEKWGYALPVKEMRPAQFAEDDANANGATWWVPDRDMIDVHMQMIVADYGAALEKTRKGREYLLEYFNWQDTANQIAALLEAERLGV